MVITAKTGWFPQARALLPLIYPPFWACLWIERPEAPQAPIWCLCVCGMLIRTTALWSFSLPRERRPFKPRYASVSRRLAVQRK